MTKREQLQEELIGLLNNMLYLQFDESDTTNKRIQEIELELSTLPRKQEPTREELQNNLIILKNDLIENLDHELENNHHQLRGYRILRKDIIQLESELKALKSQEQESKREITDEEIEEWVKSNICPELKNKVYAAFFIDGAIFGAEWYREQIKTKKEK